MYYLFIIVGISFYFCNCQKLICNNEVINTNLTEDFKINFTIVKNDSQEFDPTRKTILIIHGLPLLEKTSHHWTFQIGRKLLEWVKIRR